MAFGIRLQVGRREFRAGDQEGLDLFPHDREDGGPSLIEPWEMEDRIGYRWSDRDLLREALTHSSYGNERGLSHNERLEFLGDSVLDLACAGWLMTTYPDRREGFMAQRREGMVRGSVLAERAVDLWIDRALMVGPRGEGLRTNPGVLADALEAVVGALYLDCGRQLSTVTERLLAWGIIHG